LTLYTKLNDQTIRQILTQFDVGTLQDWQLLYGGSANTNHYLKTNKGQYVLTICERKTEAQTTILANFLKYLEAQQFNTTKIIPTKKGAAVITPDSRP